MKFGGKMVDNIYSDNLFVSSVGGYGKRKREHNPKNNEEAEEQAQSPYDNHLKSSPIDVDDDISAINNSDLSEDNKKIFTEIMSQNRSMANQLRIAEKRIKYLEDRIDNDSYLPILSKEGLIRKLDKRLDKAKMNDTTGTILYFWVFSCDRVRRNYGYDAANKMMRFVVEKFVEFSSDEAVIGRFNDFGIVKILPFRVGEDVEDFCKIMKKRIEGLNFVYEDSLINIDIRYGIAEYGPKTDNSYKLIRIADSNMLKKLKSTN